MCWTPLAFVPAPFRYLSRQGTARMIGEPFLLDSAFGDRLIPHYPAKSPLDNVLRYVTPGTDEYITEKYAFEIEELLNRWGEELKKAPLSLELLDGCLDELLDSKPLVPTSEKKVRSGNGIEVLRRRFDSAIVTGRERLLGGMKTYLSAFELLEVAQFQVVGIENIGGSSRKLRAEIRYDLAGTLRDAKREGRAGKWITEWVGNGSSGWRATRWEATEETLARAVQPVFVDVTAEAFGHTESYKSQLLRGVDYWRTVLDGACGIDVYGNNGVAAGDFDGDGYDDLYVCQPAGLPNRLYRNRGDGTFEDVTKEAGVGVLDGTACALFADFQNKGVQDLLVVSADGPLLFLNDGSGKFTYKSDAFRFQRPPEGTFTHAGAADYDGDGRLDIYLCVYSYYLGLDQYHYPAPYFDARNGPPNFLFRNEGNAKFIDRTHEAGLNVENDRYSFACAWGDFNLDGHPDLYVANDFGRSNLYRNNGNGTFSAVSDETKVNDVGAGMSAAWLDFDVDGNQDIYVSNMWSAAGQRVSSQKQFHAEDSAEIRSYYRRHADGSWLYRNLGNGQFTNASAASGVANGRWAWCADAVDFDHDGYPDLYIANGYISGPERRDVSSFFWRQVVGKSPNRQTSSPNYERGWNAVNELIRSDASWSGNERNICYANCRDGSFADVSGLVGLDFADDSRSFALADLDGDGRAEVILKNRTGPQLRILRNVMEELGESVSFRLRGVNSNRDAIGAAVTVDAGGRRQTKFLQAGSGFLSQHSKELFFGLGSAPGNFRASIRWPSGLTETFEELPPNRRIEIVEGNGRFRSMPFASKRGPQKTKVLQREEPLPSSLETWLIEPLLAPDFRLPDLTGKNLDLRSFQGKHLLLQFWALASASSRRQLRSLREGQAGLISQGLDVLAINVDNPQEPSAIRTFAEKEGIAFPILLATEEVSAVYNIIFRYLYDRRRDLPLPACFLVDDKGRIATVYQGEANPERLLEDLRSMPETAADRLQKALPFAGETYQAGFQRNDFTYGVALFQRGYLEQAAASFKQVIEKKPDNPEAYYNLGTLYLRTNSIPEARRYFQKALELRPNYPEAWNNLGMAAAQQNNEKEAIRDFQQSLLLRPNYAVALLNLGNLYRREGAFDKAEKALSQALAAEPENAEVQYSLGMLYANQGEMELAAGYLEKAIKLSPEYPDALNNLGVILVKEHDFEAAKAEFETCIRVAPKFDQAYLNLARLYILLNDKEKARQVLQALLQQDPNHELARRTLEMLN